MLQKSILKGIAGTAALLIFYFSVLTLVSGWNFARVQFSQNWYWIIGLSFGFGIQIGLLAYLRGLHRQASGKAIVASGASSGAAMIACCSHYLLNIVPIVGISGLATVIGQYQTELFLAGLGFNLIGIGYLFNKLVKFQKSK